MYMTIPLANRGLQDVNPCNLGWENCAPGHTFGPAIRDYYLIHYVVSGKGTLHSGGRAYPVKAGEIFIIRPREVTTYIADEKDPWYYIWVGFTGQAAERLNELADPVLPYQAETFFAMRRAAALTSTREEFVTGKIFELISCLFENTKQTVHHEQRAANYIDANYMNPITADSIAEAFNLDRRYLSRLFKNRMGLTISEYLIQTRLKHAALLLADGYSVSQAGAMAGYQDPFNFSKMFKKAYGMPPSVYRRNACRKENGANAKRTAPEGQEK